jgi:hypothetical protein
MRPEEHYYKTPRALRKSGGTKGGVSAAKAAESWDDCDAMPHYTYSKGWWAETKRLVDESYARLVAKGFFDNTSDYWVNRRKTDDRIQ